MSNYSKNINKYINNFLNENEGRNLSELWNSDENQHLFQTTLSKGTKIKKNPDAPKRGKSSYLFFCSLNRDKVKAEHPNMSAKEITTELGVRWNILKEQGDHAISQYVLMADEDKNRYQEQKASYIPSQPEKKKEKKQKKSKDVNLPKRAKSSYLFFCAEKRDLVKENNPDFTAKQITAELGNMWNFLKENNPDEITKYEKLSATDKTRYQSEKSTNFITTPTPISTPVSTPASTPETGFQLFCKENREKVKKENPTMKPKQITAILTSMWKEIQ